MKARRQPGQASKSINRRAPNAAPPTKDKGSGNGVSGNMKP